MDSPRLIIAPVNPDVCLSPEEGRNIKELIRGDNDIVFAFAINIWQLVDGRWEALQSNPREVPDGTEVVRP